MKKVLLIILAAGFAVNEFLEQNPTFTSPSKTQKNLTSSRPFASSTSNRAQSSTSFPSVKANNQALNNAYQNQQSDVQVNGSGTVIRTLTDDTKGSQHQRFLVKLASGNTILIAHNIDLAPRINTLREGDIIQFYGEYEWNKKGGVVHWTHRDPRGNHENGWLKHKGLTYQ